jgi:hypothetical protein
MGPDIELMNHRLKLSGVALKSHVIWDDRDLKETIDMTETISDSLPIASTYAWRLYKIGIVHRKVKYIPSF